MNSDKSNLEKYPSSDFKEKVANLPTAPGIYQYNDENQKLIYFG